MAQDLAYITSLLEDSLRRHREGKLDQAREGYLQVLQDMPDNPVALNLLGTLDAQTGHLDDAERLIRRAIVHSPKEPAYYSNLANVLQEKARYGDAIQAYRHALKLDPKLADALNNLGVLLLETDHAAEALSCFRESLAISGGTPDIHNNLGRALNNLGKLDEAAEEFRRAIGLNPDFAQAHLNLGYVLRAQRKFTYAAASFQNAIDRAAELQRAYHGLGTVYMAQNAPEQAVECFEKALELAPEDFETLLDHGILLHSLGRLHQSVAVYKKAIRLQPDSAPAFNNLGAVLLERGNLKAAESAFRQAIMIDPGFVDPYAQLGAMFDEQGRLEEMQAVVEGGLTIDQEHKQLNFEAARLALRKGEMQKAIALLSRFDLASLDSRLAQQYRYELGRACDRAGDPGMAYLHASEANRLAAMNWRTHKIDLQSIPQSIIRIQEFFEGQQPTSWQTEEEPVADSPVFLLGFPGSGVDAIAELLRHHRQVQLVPGPSALAAAVSVAGNDRAGYPECLKSIDAARLSALREVYFAQVDRMMERNPGSLLLDNQSINTPHTGLIWRLFPDARLIFMVRHPCDVILGNFMQNYSMNDTNAHFLTLEGTVSLYEKTMRLWQQYASQLPMAVQTLRYEDLCGDFEPQIDRLLRFTGLTRDASLGDFLNRLREGVEVTASSFRLQSNPFDPHSRYRWRAYADQLRPFFERLRPFTEHFSYDLDSEAKADTP